jgi:hypothetical protein
LHIWIKNYNNKNIFKLFVQSTTQRNASISNLKLTTTLFNHVYSCDSSGAYNAEVSLYDTACVCGAHSNQLEASCNDTMSRRSALGQGAGNTSKVTAKKDQRSSAHHGARHARGLMLCDV